MPKYNCLKLAKNLIIPVLGILFFFAFIFSANVYADSTNTINLQGKIVRNDAGNEGLNVTAGSPSCVVDGSANDTCDFRVRYYSASSGGTLFLTETFANKEIGQYGGAFNLSLGSGSTVAGSYSSLDALVKGESTVYVEVAFDPAGGASYTEVFTRMPLQATAYALRSKYSSEANGAFRFENAANSSGYSTPLAGMVYFDTTDTVLKVYDGSNWVNIGSGTGSSLWTDSGTYTYLTATGDHIVMGSSSYTPIGSSSYSTYMSGLTSQPPFALDLGAERLTLTGDTVRTGLTVYSNYSSTGAWPLVSFKAEDSGYDNVVLEIVQDGTGNIASFKKGSTEIFAFENAKTFFIGQRTDAPSTTVDRLYNINGTLYWNGSALGAGSSLWTDAGTYTYLTDYDDDVIIGGNNSTSAVFFFDVANARLGIGTGSPSASLDIAGSSSNISNTTGDLTITAGESLVIKGNASHNITEWTNSSGTVLSLMNQSGYATFGKNTGNTGAILTLGANTTAVAQLNLNSSSAVDVSSPVTGDLWWNGTNLYFFNGTYNVDLIGGSADIDTQYGSVNNGSYLTVAHGNGTYNVVADGWVCIGGSNNSTCSGGYWKSIKDNSTTIGHYLSNIWSKADSDGVIRSTVRLSNVELNPAIDLGRGYDGSVTVSSNTNINTTRLISSRNAACPDAPNYNITAFGSGGTQATVTPAPDTANSCLSTGDEVLIINLQGTSTSYANVGNYETLRVASVSGSTVTFETAKVKYYGDNSGDDTNLGTTTSTQRVMMQRIPNYTDVTVNSSINFYPSSWDGTKGGVIFFRSTGTVTASGTIHANAIGFRGSTTYNGDGESYNYGATTGKGGNSSGGTGTSGVSGAGGGGGNAGSTSGADGGGGGAGGGYGSGGGGGGGGGDTSTGVGGAGGTASSVAETVAGGGGGGAGDGTYNGGAGGNGGSAGSAGAGTTPGAGGAAGSTTTSGTGGNGSSTSAAGAGGGGGGGVYGVSDLSKAYLGGGGGSGGRGYASSTAYDGNNGGNGGGIVMISASRISASGAISANGAAGTNASSAARGAGGGGAGGSVLLQGQILTLSTVVTASGGAGGSRSGYGGAGGSGGIGRIATYYASSLSGTTTPTATSSQIGYYNYGIYTSPVVSTPNAQTYGDIKWDQDLATYGKVGLQTRTGNSTDPTDGTWEAWRPFTENTNYISIENADTHTNWTGTNATVAEGDVTRNVDFFEDEDETTAGNITKITSSTNGGYAEATVAAKDVSSYDYITFWIRGSVAGNTLRFGVGESAATEQYEEVTIDAVDTWQKVYWDISDITSTSRDGITVLRLTNYSTSSNTIYLDNVRGEKLLTSNTGSTISSTPNNYLQYRTIFTTTNTAYRPRLDGIYFSYNGGYRIELYDDDNVRLYNYTGETKYLKLTIVAQKYGSGADLAELYPSKQLLRPGEVVSFDTENAGYILRSRQSYDPNILGVIATQPGMVLGKGEQYTDNVYELALSGRVPMLVNPYSEDIKIGDPVTSSELSGYGKKATEKGIIVGYALENWTSSSGKDTVMIFVSTEKYGSFAQNKDSEVLSVKDGILSYTNLAGMNSKLFNNTNNLYLGTDGKLYLGNTETSSKSSAGLVNTSELTFLKGDIVALNQHVERGFLGYMEVENPIYGVVTTVDINGDVNKNGMCDSGDSCILSFDGVVDIKIDEGKEYEVGDYIYGRNSDKVGIVVSNLSSQDGFVKALLNVEKRNLVDRYLGVGLNVGWYMEMYKELSEEYSSLSVPERRGLVENGNEYLLFDDFVDNLKTSSDSVKYIIEGSNLKLDSEGKYVSKHMMFNDINKSATIWINSVCNQDISVSSSNDGGRTFVKGEFVKSYEVDNNCILEYAVEYPAEGNDYVLSLDAIQDIEIDSWVVAPYDFVYSVLNGYLEKEENIVMGKSLEIMYREGTSNLSKGSFEDNGVWRDISEGDSKYILDKKPNSVVLTNNSDLNTRLRLTVFFGSVMEENSTIASGVKLAPVISIVDENTASNTIWVNKIYEDGNLMKLQTKDKDMFTVNSNGSLSMNGDIQIMGGSIALGSVGSIRYNESNSSIEFSKDSKSWIPLGDIYSKFTLSAEYPGAVLAADGSNNFGNMTAGNEGSSSNSMNYYEWRSGQILPNDYDVRVRLQLPKDFDTWADGYIRIYFASQSKDAQVNGLSTYIFRQGSENIDATRENLVSKVAGEWGYVDIAGEELNECSSPGEVCMVVLKMASSSSNYIRVGDIEVKYSRSL